MVVIWSSPIGDGDSDSQESDPKRVQMVIIPSIIQQHAEEAAFLWLLRDRAVNAPHYSLSDLAKLDDRVEAHIDGLRIAGEEGWEICKETLALEEAGEVFTAAVLAFGSGNEHRIKGAMEAASVTPVVSRGIISALGWVSYPQAGKHIQGLLISEAHDVFGIGIRACAVHGEDPGGNLQHGLSSSDPLVRARTLKTIGELGKTDVTSGVLNHLKGEDDKCRFYAAWSASLLGNMAGLPVLKSFAETAGPFAERACAISSRRMSVVEGGEWQKAISKDGHLQRVALIGAGAIGDPDLVPWLIECMAAPEMARVAGESFSMITGVDLAFEDLEGEWPEGFEAGPTENPEDEEVALDPDEDLPWPEPKLIQEWWHKNKANFKSGVRYLCGKPISEEQCQHVLRYGYQRQRAAAAIELVMMKPGQPLFNVEAPGLSQQKLLGLK